MLALVAMLAIEASSLKTPDELAETMQGVDAGVNLIIVLGGAAFFLATLEMRWKRDRALKALHELRSIIHVIDMHQLTKDPSMLGRSARAARRTGRLTPFNDPLPRLLLGDFVADGQVAALYAQKLTTQW